MTQNVNAYLATQENIRSNKARELETARHNLAVEELSLQQHREQARHNVRSEYLTTQSLAVQQHQAETARLNVLHQANVLQETKRANRANEGLKQVANSIALYQAQSQVGLGYSQLAEARRHNKASEANQLYQISTGYDIARSNVAIGWENARIAKSNALTNSANVGVNLIDAIIPF